MLAVSNHSQSSFSALNQNLNLSLMQMNALFATVNGNVDGLQQTNRVILESAPQLENRLGGLVSLADRAAHLSAQVCVAVKQQAADAQVQRLLAEQRIAVDRHYDRLEDILQRKRLRVAIEPEFVGLSFRNRPGEPLRGLDADYARAFAQWLGVEIEFVEHGWEQCQFLLSFGRKAGEAPADLIWSALPALPVFDHLAFSKPYSFSPLILARRQGDTRIRSLADLKGRVIGCGNDPLAMETLERLGVRWSANLHQPGGRIELANLIAFSDQKRIHDALAEGVVDAFVVERPIYHWAASNPQSRWSDTLEILPVSLTDQLWCYSVGVARRPGNATLLAKVDSFIEQFHSSPRRAEIERTWQGEVLDVPASARRLHGVPGAAELAGL
ncbi:substrate-binding periplasmic protein [Pseudomonas sp. LRF_L74]|uniref:substrate-binding periplasmic protein n=1 Tax=Pseudomonas sp. LRF_L74 TaxID=3369422 RepID=UPI003F6375C9